MNPREKCRGTAFSHREKCEFVEKHEEMEKRMEHIYYIIYIYYIYYILYFNSFPSKMIHVEITHWAIFHGCARLPEGFFEMQKQMKWL